MRARGLRGQSAIGRQGGRGIARGRLFEAERRARQHAEALVARMRTLDQVTHALSGAVDLGNISRLVVERGAQVLEAIRAGIWTPSPDGAELVLQHQTGFTPEVAKITLRMEVRGPAPAAAAFREGRDIWIRSVTDYEALFPASLAAVRARRSDLGEVAMACLPLRAEDRSLGVLFFGFESRRAFDEDERTFMSLLAHHCAQAMDRARLFEEQRELARERSALLESERSARRTAEEALERARHADRRKDEFLAILSHELRNPLAPMATALQLLRLRGEPQRREIDVISRQVDHLTRLVDDLLDISRITGGKIELRRTNVELATVVSSAIEQVSPLLEQKCHRLTVDVPGVGLPVNVDPSRFAQVVSNLLTNAAKYTPTGGHIAVGAFAAGDEVTLVVRDDGIGMAQELLPQIFEPFVQAPQALDRSRGGLGLGLTIVKRLVEMHTGRVAAQSGGPGRGTEITVWVPRAKTDDLSLSSALHPSDSAAKREGSTTVLVVDDNEDAADLLAHALRGRGFVVAVAHDGPSALERANALRPQVVLLDIGLPVMDGYEVAQRLRSSSGVPLKKLIAITGYGQIEDRRRAIAAGFDLHFVKPVDVTKVLAAVSSD